MTITEFLTARYDEDEAVARRAHDDPYPTQRLWNGPGQYPIMAKRYLLADIAAKRAIVALNQTVPMRLEDDRDEGRNDMLWDVLCLLAQPYAEHPDFDPAWRAG